MCDRAEQGHQQSPDPQVSSVPTQYRNWKTYLKKAGSDGWNTSLEWTTTEHDQGRTGWTHQTRPQEYGLDLERSRGTGERQSRMASMCGPMQPSGCRMN